MNNQSEDLNPFETRNWNDILAYGEVKGEDSGKQNLARGNKFGTTS